jgi:hypothetical protein
MSKSKMSKKAARAEGAAKAERRKAKAAAPAAPEKKPKRTSALDAAAQVLAEGTPMNCKALITELDTRGLWKSPGGKTPESTLYAAILREIRTKGESARFVKVERGLFACNRKAA